VLVDSVLGTEGGLGGAVDADQRLLRFLDGKIPLRFERFALQTGEASAAAVFPTRGRFVEGLTLRAAVKILDISARQTKPMRWHFGTNHDNCGGQR